MGKIVVVTSNERMYTQALSVMEREGISGRVITTTSPTVIEDVRKLVAQGAKVVVARGNHARLLKAHTQIPLVEVVLSGQELAVLIRQAIAMAEKARPRIVLIGFRYMFSDPAPLAEVLGADVRIAYADHSDEIQQLVHQAVKDQTDVIVGGEIAVECAKAAGIKSLFLESMQGSLENAIASARRVLFAMELEEKKTAEFLSLLNYSFDAILKLDRDGNVLIANYVAEKAFRAPSRELVGRNVFDLLDVSADSNLMQAFNERKNAYSCVVRTGSEAYIANIASLVLDDAHEGYILSMQEFRQIDALEEKIRSDRYAKEHVAKFTFQTWGTASPRMLYLLSDARQCAQYDMPLLISGPFGTEKVRLCQCIHNAGIRRRNPFVSADMASLTPAMQKAQLIISSEHQQRTLFEIAHTGTLMLEHVELMDAHAQTQVLSVLKNGYIVRADGRQPLPVDVRILATTDRNLDDLVGEGKMLPSLAVYLKRMELRMPSLSERPEDIPDLVEEALNEFSATYHKYISFSAQARAYLYAHRWRMDVASLRQFIEKILLLCQDKTAELDYVKRYLPDGSAEQAAGKLPPVVHSPEEARIVSALDACMGSRARAAAMLGVSKATLWRKMKKLGLFNPPGQERQNQE